MASKFKHTLTNTMPGYIQRRMRGGYVKSCPSLQKVIANLFGFEQHNVVARKGATNGIYIYICYDGELHHFKITSYNVSLSKEQVLEYAVQIRKILMPNRAPYPWEDIQYNMGEL